MKIDFNRPLMGFDGKPLTRTAEEDETGADGPKKLPQTLAWISVVALNSTREDDKKIDGNEIARRGRLALRIYTPHSQAEPNIVDVSAEDVGLLKKLIALVRVPSIVVLRAHDLLDPVADEKEQA